MFQVAIGFSTLLFSLGLDQSYVRDFHEVDNKPALLKRASLPGLALLLGALVVVLSFGGALAGWLFGIQDWHLSVLIATALVASFVSRFLSLILRMNERGLAYSMSQVLPKLLLLGIIGSYVLTGTDKTLTNLVLAKSSALILVCAVFAYNTREELGAGIASTLDLQYLKSMLRFGLPLILGGIAYWALTAMDKIFLRTISGFEELGVYSVAVNFAAAATILQSIFSTIWAPTVYKWASVGEGLENVHKMSRYILALVIIFFCFAGLFSWVITFFLPAEYVAVQWIVVSCLGAPLLYTLSETTVVGIGISRRTGFAMIATLVAFVINLLGNWMLIPRFGAAGAAVSTCVSFWLLFLLRTEFSIYLWKPIPRLVMYFYSTLVVAGAAIYTLWGAEVGSWITVYWLSLLVTAGVNFRQELWEVLEFSSGRVFKRIAR